MKRYCKNIDLTDRKLISAAVRDCLKDKRSRMDVLELFQEYSSIPYTMLRFLVKHEEYQMLDGIIETIIDGIIEEIRNKHYVIKPIRYIYKIDVCSGKKRRIGIQNIKQQLYDYIAVYALKELFPTKDRELPVQRPGRKRTALRSTRLKEMDQEPQHPMGMAI